jgi:hypothetical protein
VKENQWASFSGQQLASVYALEADALGAIAMSPGFDNLIQQFDDYESYLIRLLNDPIHKQNVDALLSEHSVVDTAVPTKLLAQLFCQAQLAACAELFKGWKVDESQLNREGLRAVVGQASAEIIKVSKIPTEVHPEKYSEPQRQVMRGIDVIQNVDTVRVLQILKLLGLVSIQASESHQLSLGVGNGYRDLYGIHLIPRITMGKQREKVKFHFETLERQATHTVLVDNDPAYKDQFDALNRKEEGKVLALNNDAEESVKRLEIEQKGLNLKQRNLVVCLRIDHRMVPDSRIFLNLIGRVIDSRADLIMTIGAGNNLLEFEGRLKCFDEMFASLGELGLKPVRILMHGRGSSAEKRSKPNFGELAYTSYQILYCSLERDRII